jgi:hypothetical protein
VSDVDAPALSFELERVIYIRLDFALTFALERIALPHLDVRIEGPFRFQSPAGETRINPEDPSSNAPVLVLANRGAERLSCWPNGDLKIWFDNHRAILVSAEGPYEAWTMSASDGLHVIGGPSSRLSVFHS